jgi:hypothetical protein
MPAINEAAVNAAHAEFLRLNPEALEYNSEANCRKLIEYMIGQWGPQSGENSSAWEIAFRALKSGDLVPDPTYVSQADKRRMDRMSSAEVRDALSREPGFREKWDRYSTQTVPLESITNDPYVGLTAAGYAAIPPVERARLYAQNIMFRRATERLIQQGVI